MNIPSIPARATYLIQNNGNYFVAGNTSSNEQVLMGITVGDTGPEVLAVYFDASGQFLSSTSDPFPSDSDSAADGSASRLLLATQQRIGFRPGPIRIQRFAVPNRVVGIEELPDHYQEFLAKPEEHDSERQDELAGDIRQWIEDGDFVLRWDEDYYLDSKGEVVCS